MVFFVILYCLAQSQVPQHRTVILAVREPAEPLDDSLRRHPLGARERHAAVLGRHERHHRGRSDSGGAAEGAPHALSNTQRAVVAELVVLVHIVKVKAESRVRRSTMPGKTDRTYSSSSLVVCLPSVNRILPCASSALCPSAKSTCEGCRSYAEHAEPVEASTLYWSSMSSIDSPSMCGTEKGMVFGKQSEGGPLSSAG